MSKGSLHVLDILCCTRILTTESLSKLVVTLSNPGNDHTSDTAVRLSKRFLLDCGDLPSQPMLTHRPEPPLFSQTLCRREMMEVIFSMMMNPGRMRTFKTFGRSACLTASQWHRIQQCIMLGGQPARESANRQGHKGTIQVPR